MVLPSVQKKALERLSGQSWLKDFRLVGGTALALQYGHRVSEDLDFFSCRAFEVNDIVRELEKTGTFILKRKSDYTVAGTWQGAEVTFLYYQYPWITKPGRIESVPVDLARPLDIGLMKIESIGQRGARRDFIDLYFICKREKNLGELLKLYPKKYGRGGTPVYHLLKSLAYFKDARRQPEIVTHPGTAWKDVQSFFEEEVAGLARDLLK